MTDGKVRESNGHLFLVHPIRIEGPTGINNVYDAIVELVTNADDRHQILGTRGRVEIDDLWNQYDERQARGEPHPPENPVPILDP